MLDKYFVTSMYYCIFYYVSRYYVTRRVMLSFCNETTKQRVWSTRHASTSRRHSLVNQQCTHLIRSYKDIFLFEVLFFKYCKTLFVTSFGYIVDYIILNSLKC